MDLVFSGLSQIPVISVDDNVVKSCINNDRAKAIIIVQCSLIKRNGKQNAAFILQGTTTTIYGNVCEHVFISLL